MYEIKEPFWQFVDHWQTLMTRGKSGSHCSDPFAFE